MARAAKKKQAKPTLKERIDPRPQLLRLRKWLTRWLLRLALGVSGVFLLLVLLFSVVNPPITHTIWSEYRRLGEIDREWVPIEAMSPYVARSVVAAEDAQFCEHWGFDVQAIRTALEDGGQRGASTLTQQVVKNVFLWQGRSWFRKALETFLTPVVEAVWTKKRIVEVYLNVAEMGEGVFGIEAAAYRHFGKSPADLSAREAALIAAILPNPKARSASEPGDFTRRRAVNIIDGAATIERDGRAACFQH